MENLIGSYPFGDAGDPVFNATTGSFDTLKINPPIILKVKAKKVPGWILVDNSAGSTPYSPVETVEAEEIIELVPYGAARLRVTEFPVVKK